MWQCFGECVCGGGGGYGCATYTYVQVNYCINGNFQSATRPTVMVTLV